MSERDWDMEIEQPTEITDLLANITALVSWLTDCRTVAGWVSSKGNSCERPTT